MKSECSWGIAFFAIFLVSPIISGTSKIMRVHARDYSPFVYKQISNGQFNDGIEFNMAEMIAKKLDIKLEFQSFSSELDLTSSM